MCMRPRSKRVSCRRGDGCEDSDALQLSNRHDAAAADDDDDADAGDDDDTDVTTRRQIPHDISAFANRNPITQLRSLPPPRTE